MINELDERAQSLFKLNDRGSYMVGSRKLYPHQSNLGSCICAWGLSTYNKARAWQEIETLLEAQWDNGMIPHMIFREPHPSHFPNADSWGTGQKLPSSGITHPPLLATVVRAIFEVNPVRSRLVAVFDQLMSYHRWMAQNRLDNGAVCAVHPWESGRANAPDWDNALARIDVSDLSEYQRSDTQLIIPEMCPSDGDYDRYVALMDFGRAHEWIEDKITELGQFRVADPGMTFIFLRACRDLKVLAEYLRRDTAEISEWIEALEGGVETLWNEDLGAYDCRDVRAGRFANSISCSAFLDCYAGITQKKMIPLLHALFEKVVYALPSHCPNSDQFDALRYFRGPAWSYMNMLVGMGLEEVGLVDDALRIRNDTRQMIQKNGFHEYFDPFMGQPAGCKNYALTAAVWMIWAGRDVSMRDMTDKQVYA